MTTIKAFIRTTKSTAPCNIRFRVSAGRNIQLFHVSELSIPYSVWDCKKECIKSKVLYDSEQRINV